MTVGASESTAEAAPLERAQATAPLAVLLQTPLGAVVGGTLNGDVIIVSAQALAILRAGAFVRAFVLRGIESMRRTVAIAAAQICVLEYGIYRVR
jgi:hypothetical protein